MNTVLYFELRRKRRNLLKYAVVPAVVSMVLFVVCMATDAFFPFINRTYMKWPDMVKDLLSLKPWSGDLWLNVWQLFALCYPFYLIYMMMTETAEALSEEDRLETVVYLHNAGVDRKTMFGAKLLVWAGEVFACCGSLMVLHVAFAAILRQQQGMKNAFYYCTILFLVCMLYLSIVLFMAVCRAEGGIPPFPDSGIDAFYIGASCIDREGGEAVRTAGGHGASAGSNDGPVPAYLELAGGIYRKKLCCKWDCCVCHIDGDSIFDLYS